MKWWSLLAPVVAVSLASAGTAKISGTVVDENGKPVPHMTVEFSSMDMGWSGGIPQTVSDDHGHFVKEVVGPSTSDGRTYGRRWAVYPHQEENYYPHLASFYETSKNQLQEVDITPEVPEATIVVKLGPKAGALRGHVVDSVTGATLHPQFDFAWASGDPSKRMGIRTRDPYRILLPSNTDIKLIVQCEGHKAWAYPGVINVGPGQDMPLDIKMEPETSSK